MGISVAVWKWGIYNPQLCHCFWLKLMTHINAHTQTHAYTSTHKPIQYWTDAVSHCLTANKTRAHKCTLTHFLLDSRNSLWIALISSQPFMSKYFIQWVQHEDINFTQEIKYTNPHPATHHFTSTSKQLQTYYQHPYMYPNREKKQYYTATLLEEYVTHFLCPLLLRKRGHFLQEMYMFSRVSESTCVCRGYFVSPYTAGISKSFYLCHSPQFSAHWLFSLNLCTHWLLNLMVLPEC